MFTAEVQWLHSALHTQYDSKEENYSCIILLNKAMSSRDDPARGDDGTPTDVSPSPVQADLPPPLVLSCQRPPNNTSAVPEHAWTAWEWKDKLLSRQLTVRAATAEGHVMLIWPWSHRITYDLPSRWNFYLQSCFLSGSSDSWAGKAAELGHCSSSFRHKGEAIRWIEKETPGTWLMQKEKETSDATHFQSKKTYWHTQNVSGRSSKKRRDCVYSSSTSDAHLDWMWWIWQPKQLCDHVLLAPF